MAAGACAVCGQPHETCGPAGTALAPVTSFDDVPTSQGDNMGELREYMYVTNGVTTTAMLSEQDAARLGAVIVAEPAEAPEAKSRTVADKSRTVQDKGR